MKKLLTTAFLFLIHYTTFSQSLSRILDVELPLLATTTEGTAGFDSIYTTAKKDLMAYLEKKTITDADSSNELTIARSADGNVNTYSFGYPSGGTRGRVSTCMVQWKKSDGSFGVYALHTNMTVTEIHVLPAGSKHIYLMLGFEQGSSTVYRAYAQVALIKNNYLILDHPAFFRSSGCLVYRDNVNSGNSNCIACIEYCESCKAIKILDMGSDDEVGILNTKGEVETKVEKVNRVTLKFDGNRFVLDTKY